MVKDTITTSDGGGTIVSEGETETETDAEDAAAPGDETITTTTDRERIERQKRRAVERDTQSLEDDLQRGTLVSGATDAAAETIDTAAEKIEATPDPPRGAERAVERQQAAEDAGRNVSDGADDGTAPPPTDGTAEGGAGDAPPGAFEADVTVDDSARVQGPSGTTRASRTDIEPGEEVQSPAGELQETIEDAPERDIGDFRVGIPGTDTDIESALRTGLQGYRATVQRGTRTINELTPDFEGKSTALGFTQGVANVPGTVVFGGGIALKEGVEAGAAVYDDPGVVSDLAVQTGKEVKQTAEFASENPAQFAGEAGGSFVFGGAVTRGATTRGVRAARRGRTRARQAAPDRDALPNEIDRFISDTRAQQQLRGRQRERGDRGSRETAERAVRQDERSEIARQAQEQQIFEQRRRFGEIEQESVGPGKVGRERTPVTEKTNPDIGEGIAGKGRAMRTASDAPPDQPIRANFELRNTPDVDLRGVDAVRRQTPDADLRRAASDRSVTAEGVGSIQPSATQAGRTAGVAGAVTERQRARVRAAQASSFGDEDSPPRGGAAQLAGLEDRLEAAEASAVRSDGDDLAGQDPVAGLRDRLDEAQTARSTDRPREAEDVVPGVGETDLTGIRDRAEDVARTGIGVRQDDDSSMVGESTFTTPTTIGPDPEPPRDPDPDPPRTPDPDPPRTPDPDPPRTPKPLPEFDAPSDDGKKKDEERRLFETQIAADIPGGEFLIGGGLDE